MSKHILVHPTTDIMPFTCAEMARVAVDVYVWKRLLLSWVCKGEWTLAVNEDWLVLPKFQLSTQTSKDLRQQTQHSTLECSQDELIKNRLTTTSVGRSCYWGLVYHVQTAPWAPGKVEDSLSQWGFIFSAWLYLGSPISLTWGMSLRFGKIIDSTSFPVQQAPGMPFHANEAFLVS